jgi:hypothetical protein
MAKITLITEDQARELTREARRKARNRLVQDQVQGAAVRGGFHGKGGYTRKSRGGKNWLHADD